MKARKNNLPPFDALMRGILDRSGGDPMGGLKPEWNRHKFDPPKVEKQTTTNADAGIAVFVDDFRDHVWRNCFFPKVERLADADAISVEFRDEI